MLHALEEEDEGDYPDNNSAEDSDSDGDYADPTQPTRLSMIECMIKHCGPYPPSPSQIIQHVPWRSEPWKVGDFLAMLRRAVFSDDPLTETEIRTLTTASQFYLQPPTRLFMIRHMIDHVFGKYPPDEKTEVPPVVVPWSVDPWDVGQFLKTVRALYYSDDRLKSELDDHEHKALVSASEYYLNPPNRLSMIRHMIEIYSSKPPEDDDVLEIVPWMKDKPWHVGAFLKSLRKPKTPLSDYETELLNKASRYYLDPVCRLRLIQYMVATHGSKPPTKLDIDLIVPWSRKPWTAWKFLQHVQAAAARDALSLLERDTLRGASEKYLTVSI